MNGHRGGTGDGLPMNFLSDTSCKPFCANACCSSCSFLAFHWWDHLSYQLVQLDLRGDKGPETATVLAEDRNPPRDAVPKHWRGKEMKLYQTSFTRLLTGLSAAVLQGGQTWAARQLPDESTCDFYESRHSLPAVSLGLRIPRPWFTAGAVKDGLGLHSRKKIQEIKYTETPHKVSPQTTCGFTGGK